MTSIALGEHLMDFSKEYGCGFMTLDEEDLKTHNLNLLAAVGQASRRSPSRLHVITHNYDPDKPVLLLIGKGVTFDTGGINLKPHESYVNCMKNDMAGAAMMTQLFMALVKAQVKQPLILAIPCCENLIDAQSMKPGSIITAHNGKKVIIEHTDAEGRLIIADTMSYCHQYFRPSQTLIAATLTTAALWQFSNFFTGVHFASPDFEKEILEHGHLWGEGFRFWPEFLPFAAGNKHPAADLTNMGHMPGQADKAAKSCVAAHFLRAFAKHPMVHFDIFASAWNWTGDYPGSHYGTTGAVINTLFELLLRRETKHDRNA
jgi:leucyl aminopeptidase